MRYTSFLALFFITNSAIAESPTIQSQLDQAIKERETIPLQHPTRARPSYKRSHKISPEGAKSLLRAEGKTLESKPKTHQEALAEKLAERRKKLGETEIPQIVHHVAKADDYNKPSPMLSPDALKAQSHLDALAQRLANQKLKVEESQRITAEKAANSKPVPFTTSTATSLHHNPTRPTSLTSGSTQRNDIPAWKKKLLEARQNKPIVENNNQFLPETAKTSQVPAWKKQVLDTRKTREVQGTAPFSLETKKETSELMNKLAQRRAKVDAAS